MIALLNSGEYFMEGCEDINEFLFNYAEYVGGGDLRVLKILINSNAMSTSELVDYINKYFCSYNETINEIYEAGKKIY